MREYSFWFVVGSQLLYGPEVLETVAARAAEMAKELSRELPYPLVYKVTAKSNQEIAQVILEEAGFSVEIAGNGEIATEMLRASQPGHYQLILMDIQMPVMNGYDATRAIRKLENPELAAIPILAMTANAFEEDKQEAIKSGMNGHIAKPIDIDELMKALDNVLL